MQCTEGTRRPSAPQQVPSRSTAELCLYTDRPHRVSEVSNPLFCSNPSDHRRIQRRFWKIRVRKHGMDVLHSQPLELRHELDDSGPPPPTPKATTSPHLSCLFEKHSGARRRSLPSPHASSSRSGSDGRKPAPRVGSELFCAHPEGRACLIASHKSLPSPILSLESLRFRSLVSEDICWQDSEKSSPPSSRTGVRRLLNRSRHQAQATKARIIAFSWQLGGTQSRLGSVGLDYSRKVRDINPNVGGSGGSPPAIAQVSGWVRFPVAGRASAQGMHTRQDHSVSSWTCQTL